MKILALKNVDLGTTQETLQVNFVELKILR